MRTVFGASFVLAITLLATPAHAQNANDAGCKVVLNADQRAVAASCTKQLDTQGLPKGKRAMLLASRCFAYGRSGELDRAVDDCSEAIRLDPRLGGAYHYRAFALRLADRLDPALSDYGEVIRLKPEWRGEAHAARARVWYEKGDLNSALADLDAAARANPNNWSLHYVRALVWIRKGDFDRAVASASEAIRVMPQNSQGYSIRGESWRMKGDLDRALADQDKAVEIPGSWSVSFTRRADTRRYRGENDRAIADYDRALRSSPGYVPALVGRGLTYERMGDLGRAKAAFEEAISSEHQIKTGDSRSARETALARLAAFGSGAAQPVIPAASARATSATSIPTPSAAIPAVAAEASKQGNRVALVIGNSGYKNVPRLANPQRDAASVAASLRAIGFESVTLADDATREKLTEALRGFADRARRADWAMVYYAGHGIEVNGVNFLVPVDARLAAGSDVESEAVQLQEVLTAVEGARKLGLVLLDACRDNPFALQAPRVATATSKREDGGATATRSVGRGLGQVKVTGATLVVYAAKHGQTALDGEGGNSPFAVAVTQRLATPNVEINKLFRLVRDDVMEATAGRQEPFTYGSLPGREDFFFVTR